MGLSLIQEIHDTVIDTIKKITAGDWKVLVIDEGSKKILDNVVKEDDILNHNIANIERIEERREMNPTMDAVYLLSPLPHIVECVAADLDRRRYRQSFLVWTGPPPNGARRRLETSPAGKQQIAGFDILSLDFYPRESHLVTFRDPWSFPILYHPACNGLVREHMRSIASKIVGVCVSLGEYPKVRFYRPQNPLHDASVLCGHLARFVQTALDEYANYHPEFPPQTTRPQGILLITDRSMDLMAPLIHEFTYQAMAHDLLPIKEGDKVTFHMTINEGQPGAEEKDMELQEKDKVWVENRHRHMKDTIDKLMGDFQKFLAQNPHFADESGEATSINAIKDMLAGLPQFQEMKEAYSLHLTMAQECMNYFSSRKLPDIGSIEQTLATGFDEDWRKPKNVLDQIVRLLDDEAVEPSDRFRLIIMYLMFRDGVIPDDVTRLLAHAQLPPQRGEIIANLDFLGARTTHVLKEVRPAPPPLFPLDTKTLAQSEEYALSRFEPAVKHMLDNICRGALDATTFPHTVPPLDPNEDAMLAAGQGSLRAAKPSWAGAGRRVPENRQRVVVFMAGGATYSESRACYEASAKHNRDVVLVTSHMLTPSLFVRQVGDLSADRRRLDIPMERPPPKPPAHLFERERPTPPPMGAGPGAGRGMPPGVGQPIGGGPRGARPPPQSGIGGIPSSSRPGGSVPTQQMGQMSLGGGQPLQAGPNGRSGGMPPSTSGSGDGKLPKDKEKKKRNIFGLKKS